MQKMEHTVGRFLDVSSIYVMRLKPHGIQFAMMNCIYSIVNKVETMQLWRILQASSVMLPRVSWVEVILLSRNICI